MRATKSSMASVPWIELEPEAEPARHHRPLAGVGGAERRDDARRRARRRPRSASPGCARVSTPGGRQQVGEDLVRRGAARSPRPRRSRRPAAACESSPDRDAAQQLRRQPQHREVEAQRVQLGPGHAAGEGDDAAARRRAGRRRAGPASRRLRGEHRMPVEPVERHALEHHHAVGPAAARAVLGDQPRQVAAPGDDGEPVAGIRSGRHGERARGLGGDERDHLRHQRVAGDARSPARRTRSCSVPSPSNISREGGAQPVDVVARRRRRRFRPTRFRPGEMRPLAHDRAVGDHVGDDAGQPADHRAAAEAHELVHRRRARRAPRSPRPRNARRGWRCSP